ncbi:MAG: fumarylacetoacetate hydrolase family protein [Planctomycetes bacterium]|nr:fumarylacetoacetate hydrolase family protein [Planctomycetota bacterium]
MRYVRFQKDRRRAYGIVEGEMVRALAGSPFRGAAPEGPAYALAEVKLLPPCEPTKILAMAGNYKSHLADTPPHANPEIFWKPPSCLLEPEGTIVIPKGTADVHYEGEFVIVIGRRAKDVPKAEALSYVFGYTCGNDVSARDWQKDDVQWWRAKGCDTFGPLGPWIVAGIDGGDLALTTRLNGEVKQKARTSELIFGVADIVSFASAHVTLLPGDIIFTGTPGTTSAMEPGDRVEVEIEKIGVLRNRVA